MDEAKEYVRKLNIISTNKEKEPEPEVEKDEIDVNTFFGILFLTAIICIKMLRIQTNLCSIALYNSRNSFYRLERWLYHKPFADENEQNGIVRSAESYYGQRNVELLRDICKKKSTEWKSSNVECWSQLINEKIGAST